MNKTAAALIVLALAVGVIQFGRWALFPRHNLPRNRARHLRLRLRLRLHPGPGHASAFELWLRWSRWASFRESKRVRPSLGFWYRLRHSESHSFFFGRAHHGRGLRASRQTHTLVVGPPRSYKSALLSRMVMEAGDSSCVVTTTKPDLHRLTSGLRAQAGPVWTFNPQLVGDIPNTVRWSPLSGCLDPDVAIRRGVAFAASTSTEGAEDAAFWRGEAQSGLMGLMHAGALSRSDMRKVGRWAGISDETPEAVAVLEAASAGDWAAKIRELNGPAERTAATVRTVMTSCLSFLRSPTLAATVLPLPGQPEFDIPRFLREHGTIYLIARGDQPDTPLAGLFTALICEIAYQAVLMGSRMPDGRLDPPLFMCLDELCQVAGGVPAPSWLSDVGGQGISLAIAAHGFAQLENRYKRAGAQQIVDCSNTRIFLPGLVDTETLERASKLCDHATFSRPGATTTTDELVMTPGMIRQLPPGRALFIRDGHSPVIGRVARGWEHRPYKRLQRLREDAAPITPPADAIARIPAPLSLIPALADFEPAPELATTGNGNGHKNGEHPWSAK